MRFMLNIACDNAAFAGDNLGEQVGAILDGVACQVSEDGLTEGTMRDSNGNTVGRWAFYEDPDGMSDEVTDLVIDIAAFKGDKDR